MKRRHGNNDAIHEVCHKSINDAKQVQNMVMQICMVMNEWFDESGLVTHYTCDDINNIACGNYDVKQWRKYKPRSWQLCNS